jgi:hypothetical protein
LPASDAHGNEQLLDPQVGYVMSWAASISPIEDETDSRAGKVDVLCPWATFANGWI